MVSGYHSHRESKRKAKTERKKRKATTENKNRERECGRILFPFKAQNKSRIHPIKTQAIKPFEMTRGGRSRAGFPTVRRAAAGSRNPTNVAAAASDVSFEFIDATGYETTGASSLFNWGFLLCRFTPFSIVDAHANGDRFYSPSFSFCAKIVFNVFPLLCPINWSYTWR